MTFFAVAQSNKLQSNTCSNVRLLDISLSNLLSLIRMTHSEFNQAMTVNNYKLNSSLFEDCYLNENGPAGSPYYVISKNPGEATMMWTLRNCGMISKLQDELERFYIKSVDGYYVYRLKSNDASYTITLQVKGESGSVNISK